MAKQKRISVSFSRKYASEYEYIINLTNSSDFVCEAIREKMQSGMKKPFELNDYIRRIIEQVISEKSSFSILPNPLHSQVVPADQVLIDAVDSFEL